MKRNIFVEMSQKHPGCDIVLMVAGDEVPPDSLPAAVQAVLKSEITGVYRANSSSGVCLFSVKQGDTIKDLREKTFEKQQVTKGWPHIRIASNAMAMYLFDISDMITFETMCDDSVVDLVDPETAGSDTKIVLAGANLLPICMGEVEIHKVKVSDGLPEPLKLLTRVAIKSLLLAAGVEKVPHGFFENLAETFIIAPYDRKLDRYCVTFKGTENCPQEEYEDLTIEQVFALYELRNTTTIQ